MTRKKRKPKSNLKKLQQILWQIVREIVFIRDGATCVTCGQKNLQKRNKHCGHFIPKAVCSYELKYNPDNLGTQCARCNLFLGGYQAMFYRYIENKYGKAFIDNLFILNQHEISATEAWYEEQIIHYTAELSKLKSHRNSRRKRPTT